MNHPYRNPLPALTPTPSPAPHSGERTTCRKCGHTGLTLDEYQAVDDTVTRKCLGCRFTWSERPVDAS